MLFSAMDTLLFDLIRKIAEQLPIEDVCHLSQSSWSLYRTVQWSNPLWKYLFHRDIEAGFSEEHQDWRELYIHYGTVWVYGENTSGRLGLGDMRNRKIECRIPKIRAQSVHPGAYHTIIIDLNGNAWAMGNNSKRQLGLNLSIDSVTHPQRMKLSQLAKSAVVGDDFTFIHTVNNTIICFGGPGQLFGRVLQKFYKFMTHNPGGAFLIDTHDNLYRLEIADRLKLYNKHKKAKYVACSSNHTFMVDMENNLWAQGVNNFGQLGLGHTNYCNNFREVPFSATPMIIALGLVFSFVLDTENNLWFAGKLNNHKSEHFILFDSIKVKAITVTKFTVMYIDMEDHIHYISCINGDFRTELPTFYVDSISCTSDTYFFISHYPFRKNVMDFDTLAYKIQNNLVETVKVNGQTVDATIKGETYSVEVSYNPITNEIFPPLPKIRPMDVNALYAYRCSGLWLYSFKGITYNMLNCKPIKKNLENAEYLFSMSIENIISIGISNQLYWGSTANDEWIILYSTPLQQIRTLTCSPNFQYGQSIVRSTLLIMPWTLLTHKWDLDYVGDALANNRRDIII